MRISSLMIGLLGLVSVTAYAGGTVAPAPEEAPAAASAPAPEPAPAPEATPAPEPAPQAEVAPPEPEPVMSSFTSHWYGGAAISRSSYSGTTLANGSPVEPNHGTGGKLFLGYRFNPNLAVEASGVYLGSTSSIKGEGGSLDVLGIAPVSSSINLFAKVGVADLKAQGADSNSYKAGLNYGVGGMYALNDDWSARLEAERFQKVGNHLKANLYSLGIQYGF